jgi:hypothetical protein
MAIRSTAAFINPPRNPANRGHRRGRFSRLIGTGDNRANGGGKGSLPMSLSEAYTWPVAALSDEPSVQVLRSPFALFPPVDSVCSFQVAWEPASTLPERDRASLDIQNKHRHRVFPNATQRLRCPLQLWVVESRNRRVSPPSIRAVIFVERADRG